MKLNVLLFILMAFVSNANAQLRELGSRTPPTQEQINADNLQNLDAYKDLLQQIQAGTKEIPANKPNYEVEITNTVAWLQMLTGDFKSAEKTLKKGLKKSPKYEFFLGNMPPTLLMLGKFEEAKKQYAALKDNEMKAVGKTYKVVFLEDLAEIEKTGFVPQERKDDLAKMRAFLKE
jgi:tetratricopeptide (TPR) repeat protein